MQKSPVSRLILSVFVLIFASCSVQRQIGKKAQTIILGQPEFGPANVGIAIADVATGKSLYTYRANKLYVPASNTKLFTCYAAMKYLGDSILSGYYTIEGDRLLVEAAGDPTFLNTEFAHQPLFNLMKNPRFAAVDVYARFKAQPLGRGWAWDDYTEVYMAERDPLPMYGNVATLHFNGITLATIPPKLPVLGMPEFGRPWAVTRELGGHFYTIENDKGSLAATKTITMALDGGEYAEKLLGDTLHKTVERLLQPLNRQQATPVYTMPVDSLLKITMQRSDNFFAEQILLMVSNKMLGTMTDSRIIDTLLQTNLAGLPQRPKWVDGSGLSRYNLVSPNDFVWLLQKMNTEFGLERLKTILPAANTGTLKGLYKGNEGRIFAKTGTLSNNVALSGYLLTKNNRTLVFSVLVNNHISSATAIRQKIEQFLTGVIERY